MGALNQAILFGNLGSNPEVRYTQNGAAVANFSMATNESWTDQQGQRQEETEWHRIVCWGKTAEAAQKYLAKGSQVVIVGKIKTRKWQDRNGNDQKTTEIHARTLQFVRDGQGREGRGGAPQGAPQGYGGGPPAEPSAGGQPQEQSQSAGGPLGPEPPLAPWQEGGASLPAQGPPASNTYDDDGIPFD